MSYVLNALAALAVVVALALLLSAEQAIVSHFSPNYAATQYAAQEPTP